MRRLMSLAILAVAAVPAAAQNFDTVTVRVVPVTQGVAMLVGAGGNLAVAWGAEATFLREVRTGACDLFATVLSPDYNAAHRDHLHFDQADRGGTGWGLCR